MFGAAAHFALGVLDLAVGNFVLEAAISSGAAIAFPDFFSNSADGKERLPMLDDSGSERSS